MNSRNKGKRGELEWADWLRANLGIEAKRAQQHCGAAGDADLITDDGVHWEVKRVEKLNLQNAMDQAVSDCPDDRIPAVAHRRNRGEWLVTLRAVDLERFIMKQRRSIAAKMLREAK